MFGDLFNKLASHQAPEEPAHFVRRKPTGQWEQITSVEYACLLCNMELSRALLEGVTALKLDRPSTFYEVAAHG